MFASPNRYFTEKRPLGAPDIQQFDMTGMAFRGLRLAVSC